MPADQGDTAESTFKGQAETIRAKLAAAAVKPVSSTPHLDALEKLSGAEATAFYRQHSKAIAAEQGQLRRQPRK